VAGGAEGGEDRVKDDKTNHTLPYRKETPGCQWKGRNVKSPPLVRPTQ